MKWKGLQFKMQCRHLFLGWAAPLLIILFAQIAAAQTQSTVIAEIDSISIRIGEQIQYKITVETDSLNLVYFPEDQTFSPLEMVEALKIDTTKNNDRITLQRIYALTQFDSGAYTIPPQRIAINEKPFFTDSFQIRVNDVVVDTTKQKMFDIKPLIEVERSNSRLLQIFLWVILGLLIIGALVWWFYLRPKPLTEDEKVALLPPYDRALLQLKELENSRYLIQDEYKKYYSELTDIVRSYLDEDVNISALESTTDQLIERLELLKDAGELKIDEDTINQFQRVLKTADLVKFAKSKPPTSVAEQDRTVIQNIVVKTKEALPEPDLEDLLKNEAYLEELAKKKQRKRIYIAAAALASLLILAGATATTYYGFTTVKDTVLGHPTKKLLEQEWVTSTYGFPPIQITTPEVLLRQEVELPPEAKKEVKAIHVFGYQSDVSLFTVLASATTFAEANEPDFDKPIEQLLSSFEQQGAKNIITKQEEFTTVAGVKGLKTFGSGKFKIPDSEELIQGKYTILSFGGNGFMQQIVLTWLDEDIYAEQIVERVLASVDVKTQA